MKSFVPRIFLAVGAAVFLIAPSLRAQSLLENGNFENAANPFQGWVTDYAWTGNSYYINNKEHLSIASEGERKNFVKFADAGQGGVKIESHPIALEPGYKYVCDMDVKGGGYRLYFAGYQWTPGVAPHPNPEISELRMIYQSKAATGSSPSWKKERIELPGVKLSQEAMAHLKKVRFITVYIWMVSAGGVDNVTLTKVADPAMNF